MNYEASFGILVIFFLWVILATIWWRKRINTLMSEKIKESESKDID